MNLGTPASPAVRDVRRYLTEFLNDPYVIDIPWLPRKLLVNGIIVPFRAPKSAKAYEELWEVGNGESPLMTYSISVRKKLATIMKKDGVQVELAMRYGDPSIMSAVRKLQSDGVEMIHLIPLYPQYALASTRTVITEFERCLTKLRYEPMVATLKHFCTNSGYLDVFASRASSFDLDSYDHVIFSYHGLPTRQIEKTHGVACNDECVLADFPANPDCYKAQCYATTRGLVTRLGLKDDQYTVSFQSRLDDKWIKPYSDVVLTELAQHGAKRVLVFSPAFVTDCLETIVEIGSEYQELFEEHGGDKVDLVPSLNDGDDWVEALYAMIKNK